MTGWPSWGCPPNTETPNRLAAGGITEVVERVGRDQGARAQQSGLGLSLALPAEPIWAQGAHER